MKYGYVVECTGCDKDFKQAPNSNSKEVVTAYLEHGMARALPDDKFQFERHGYFVADRVDSKPGKPVFNRVVTLKDSWGVGVACGNI